MDIRYNAFLALLAGASMATLAWFGYGMRSPSRLTEERARGFGLSLIGLGVLTSILGTHLTLTWALTSKPHISALFGNVPMFLGVFTVIAGAYILLRWHKDILVLGQEEDRRQHLQQLLDPLRFVFIAAGLAIGFFGMAVFGYGIFGAAPPQEPIHFWLADKLGPWPLRLYAGGAGYVVPALVLFLLPVASRNLTGRLWRWCCVALVVCGLAVALYGAATMFTQYGMAENFAQ